jgi:undecaprenyl-diphosphatase
VLAYLVRAEAGPVVSLDEAAIVAGTEIVRGRPSLQQALLAWQEAFQARWVNLVCALVCLWAWRRRGLTSRATWAFVTLMVTWALNLGVKFLVQRTRPVVEEALTHAPGYSFPSGHAMNTAAAGATMAVLLWPLLGGRGRAALLVVVTLAVAITGADRVLLGAHYPSDVVAGIALGAAMVVGSYVGYVGWRPPEAEAGPPDRTSGHRPGGARSLPGDDAAALHEEAGDDGRGGVY